MYTAATAIIDSFIYLPPTGTSQGPRLCRMDEGSVMQPLCFLQGLCTLHFSLFWAPLNTTYNVHTSACTIHAQYVQAATVE